MENDIQKIYQNLDKKSKSDIQKIYEIFDKKLKNDICDILYSYDSDIQLIKHFYNIKYSRDLILDIRKNIKGNTKRFLIGILCDPLEYDCRNIEKSVSKLIQNDYNTVIEILATRTTDETKAIKENISVICPDFDIKKIFKTRDSWLNKFLFDLWNSKRSFSKKLSENECKIFAKTFLSLENSNSMTFEVLNNYFIETSQQDFKKIAQYYFQISGKTILQYIKNNYNGYFGECLIAISYGMLCPYEYFYKKLDTAIENKDCKAIIRIIISRKNDFKKIKQIYTEKKGKNIAEDILNIINVNKNLFNKIINE